jgi:hypothetical protein
LLMPVGKVKQGEQVGHVGGQGAAGMVHIEISPECDAQLQVCMSLPICLNKCLVYLVARLLVA